MKLSVAMCTYNGAAHVREQLESMTRQTRLPDELVVCDDGSRDETLGILEAFKSRASFPVEVVSNRQHLGLLKNFAQAISLCRGEIISLSDQDDVWLPEKLARTEAEFERTPDAGLVFSDMEVVGEDLRPLGFTAWQSYTVELGRREQELFRRGKALDVLLTHNVITGAAAAFRAEYRELILPFPEVSKYLLHDYWTAMMIATVARVVPVAEPLVKYRTHSDQQVGLDVPPTYGSAREERRRKRKRYSSGWEYLMLLAGRLAERAAEEPQYKPALHSLRGRVAHARARINLSQRRIHHRLWYACGELLAGRYHAYRRPDHSAWSEFLPDIMPRRIIGLKEALTIKKAAR